MSEPVPSRRRFRWSLRAIFLVITLFGCWLGLRNYYGAWMQDRLRVAFPDYPEESQLTPRQREVLEAIRGAFPEARVEVIPPYTGDPI